MDWTSKRDGSLKGKHSNGIRRRIGFWEGKINRATDLDCQNLTAKN